MVTDQEFLNEIYISNWFSNMGRGRIVLHDKSNDIKVLDSLDEAILVWQKNYDNRCEVWEDLRVKLLNNARWESNYNKFREVVKKLFYVNDSFVALAGHIREITGLEEEYFLYQLPIIGYWGEMILGITGGFYERQVEVFKQGFFVCSYNDNAFMVY